MKQIKIPCYNNSNIEVLTSKIIITITVKTITIIKLHREKKKQVRTKIEIIIINNINFIIALIKK